MTNNELTNWGESWYEFRYFSFREGAFCGYKMTQEEYDGFAKEFEEKKELFTKNGIRDVPAYIRAVLSYNN
jgi:hypothetical protein